MLSILVPTYNYNVYPLAVELHKQCLECNIDFEILCQDDASHSPLNVFNEKINLLSHASFVALKQNIAHRENRNSLAEKAKFEYLLFVDGDSNILSFDYIKNYLSNLCDFDVIYGGRIHPDRCPSDNQKLRWKYGRLIEDKTAEKRKIKPYHSLLFNNTIIKKNCFNSIKFDKTIKKYGHDDTQLSFQLSKLKSKINHIENPVEHGSIDTNLEYFNKTKESLENLITLHSEAKVDVEFVRMLKLYHFLQVTKSTFIISKTHAVFKKLLFKNLTGKNPNILVYNLFRVGYLCSIALKSKT
ncbi:glycosyltransferase [Flavobacterium sp. W20_MBD1_R3]|uniref:glycosyltransferase n=1 Tax=Flavobacterium sp. W20_MBD1_R3 TaxID=3240278 RepID=UPI003F919668